MGTVTEIYDYLRLLWARIGIPYCPVCKKEISRQSVDQIIDSIQQWPNGTRYMVIAPIVRDKKGEHKQVFEKIKADGFVRVRVSGEILSLSEEIRLEPGKKHTIEVVVDRLTVKEGDFQRLNDSLETSLSLADDIVIIPEFLTMCDHCLQ
ncbi:UvrABC system protein A [compost metagenome]